MDDVADLTADPWRNENAARASLPFVEVAGGHRLFVRDWGSGEPVLFLAGWGMDSSSWGACMARLIEAGLRALAYDRRGHGRSTDPGRADFDDLARDLAAVIDGLDLRGLTLVAHSGGAGEAVRYASRFGCGRLRRIILVGATGPCMTARPGWPQGFPPEAVAGMLDRIAGDLPVWIDESSEAFAPGAPRRLVDQVAATMLGASRQVLLDFQRAIASTDMRPELGAVTVPVTLVHGDLDASAPLDLTARAYARLLPDAELVVYDGAAHGVMLTHVDRLARDIMVRCAAAVGAEA